MSETAAQSTIEGLGLVYEKGDDVNSDTIDAGLAVSTDPGEGTSVLLGSTVTVHFSSGSAMVNVPDVSGQSQADARTAITDAGLTVGDVTTEDSTEVASGAVIRTDPVAGTSVERGSSVSLVVSSGKTTVPSVVGLSQEEAQSAITAAGLTYNSSTVEETTDDESKDGQYLVTAVDPSEGSSVDANSSVTLTVTHYTYEAPATTEPTQQATDADTSGSADNGKDGNEG